MKKQINFDMDGTIANLYGVDGWLEMLRAESAEPYEKAEPLVNMNTLAKYLHKAQKNGYKITVISWTAKNGTKEYNKKVAKAKKKWLKKHLKSVHFDEITIVPYGTPKSTCGDGILFDDEEQNRTEWNQNNDKAFDVNVMMTILKNLG